MFGSILPDIDEIHTILGRFNILAWLGVMEHRGITHTLLASLLFGLFFSIGGIDAGLCLWVGYLSHLWLDSKTPMGIRWLYPLKK